MTVAAGSAREILVGISRRMSGLVKCEEPMLRVLAFEAFVSHQVLGALAMFVVVGGHRGGLVAAVKVAMVFMALNGSYRDARSHSTGNNFLFYIVLTEYTTIAQSNHHFSCTI